MSPVSSPPVNKWLVAASVSCGSIMGVLDSTIVNVALPQIQGAVGATLQEITWITTGYTIAAIISCLWWPFSAAASDRSACTCSASGCSFSEAASVGCSDAASSSRFASCRGSAGGRCSRRRRPSCARRSPKSEQGMAMALTGMIMMVGPALGPVLGGYIVDHFHWAWIFYVSLPIGLLAW